MGKKGKKKGKKKGGAAAAAAPGAAAGGVLRLVKNIRTALLSCGDARGFPQLLVVQAATDALRAAQVVPSAGGVGAAAGVAAGGDGASLGDRLATFSGWLRENGMDTSRFTFGPCGDAGNGVMAVLPVAAGDVVAAVPRALMLAALPGAAGAAAEGAGCPSLVAFWRALQDNPLLQSNGSVALALRLLVERARGGESFFKPYLDILPAHFSVSLYMDPAAELAQLRDASSGALPRCVKNVMATAQLYAYLYELNAGLDGAILDPAEFTYDAFRWAMTIASTRQNMIPTSQQEGGGAQLALIPVFDMFNHRPGGMRAGYEFDDGGNGPDHSGGAGAGAGVGAAGGSRGSRGSRGSGGGMLQVCTEIGVEEGEQFFIDYGPRDNVELFIYAGFVQEGNTNDTYPLTITLDDPSFSGDGEVSAGLLRIKAKMLEKVRKEERERERERE